MQEEIAWTVVPTGRRNSAPCYTAGLWLGDQWVELGGQTGVRTAIYCVILKKGLYFVRGFIFFTCKLSIIHLRVLLRDRAGIIYMRNHFNTLNLYKFLAHFTVSQGFGALNEWSQIESNWGTENNWMRAPGDILQKHRRLLMFLFLKFLSLWPLELSFCRT